jgi:hypothetical protein
MQYHAYCRVPVAHVDKFFSVEVKPVSVVSTILSSATTTALLANCEGSDKTAEIGKLTWFISISGNWLHSKPRR